MKNRKRESCTSGTVRDEDGNILIYSARPLVHVAPMSLAGIRNPQHERTLTERQIIPPGSNPDLFDLWCLRSRHGAPAAGAAAVDTPSGGVHARLARTFEAVSATNLVPINDSAEPSASA
jgi:hypothetical protein